MDVPPRKPAFQLRDGQEVHEVGVGPVVSNGGIVFRMDGEVITVQVTEKPRHRYLVRLGERTFTLRAILEEDRIHLQAPSGVRVLVVEPFLSGAGEQAAGSGNLLSPMMGRIIALKVQVGDSVKAEDVLAVQESMKMAFNIKAPWDGVITEVLCEQEQMVERHSHIITIEPLKPGGQG